jgi:transposase
MGSFRRAGFAATERIGCSGSTVRYRTRTGGPNMYYVGIDVASQESAVCILDSKGKIVREAKLSTDPEALGRFLADTGLAIERVGLESGCTAAWLFTGLQERGWPVICIDARHAAAALQAGFRNKNDRNDAASLT